MSFAIYIKNNYAAIDRALAVYQNPFDQQEVLSEDEFAVQTQYAEYWVKTLIEFEQSGMLFLVIFSFQQLFVIQLFFQATFAGRNKRIMKYF